jgi:hypothetical protein
MILFIFRLLLNLLLLIGIILPLEILGWIVLLPVVYIYRTRFKLPYFLRWFDNADVYDAFGRNSVTYTDIVLTKSCMYRYYWLAFRNPLNYFGYKILGFKSDIDIPESHVGDSVGKTEGWSYIELSNGTYEYYLIHKWNSTHCLRFRMGWKLQDTKKGDWVQWVLVLQPYRSYGGL